MSKNEQQPINWDLRNDIHRQLATEYCHLVGSISPGGRRQNIFPESPEVYAKRVIDIANKIPNGEGILLQLSEEMRKPHLQKPVEYWREQKKHLQKKGKTIHESEITMVDAAS